MAHWASMTSTTVRPAEWRILRAIDRAWLIACNEQAERDRIADANPNTVSERPMSPELWDAIF